MRSCTLRYFCRSKLFSSVCSWWSVKAVRAFRCFLHGGGPEPASSSPSSAGDTVTLTTPSCLALRGAAPGSTTQGTRPRGSLSVTHNLHVSFSFPHTPSCPRASRLLATPPPPQPQPPPSAAPLLPAAAAPPRLPPSRYILITSAIHPTCRLTDTCFGTQLGGRRLDREWEEEEVNEEEDDR
ncbi:hypothetical protein E2C01_078368 [Portunus trituberculatus]|uniref:Uncharacterized protein n=1 Tax=Portunus trituberculatus TaxID=210409 RepID=A0A5B7IMF4_PORTR|nr:hypothetical protein [Portunus trituberculatus]